MDRGKSRNYADDLSIQGYQNCSILASAVGWLKAYFDGTIDREVKHSYSRTESQEVLKTFPGIADSVKLCGANKTRLCGAGLLSALHYVMHDKDPELADSLVYGMKKGYDKTVHPVLFEMRELLMRELMASKKHKFSGRYTAAIIIKAFNFTRKRVDVRQLRFISGEAFPAI